MGLFKSVEAPTHELIKDSKWSSILGPNLMDKNGKLAQTDDVLKFGKVKRVAIYFSAHWCPPCRRFTPFLASFYEEMQNQVDDDELEIVFVSSDHDPVSYEEYRKEQPWVSLPFASPIKPQLSSLFGVSGIPFLIVLDSRGKILDNQARATVSKFKGDVMGMLALW